MPVLTQKLQSLVDTILESHHFPEYAGRLRADQDDQQDNGTPEERVVYRARVHWSVYLPGAVVVLWGGIPTDSRLAGWFVIFGAILLAPALAAYLVRDDQFAKAGHKARKA